MMATGFLGYTLPWGQMSFWGATVITNFFSAIPIVGESVVTWLWGGYGVGNPTLQRFFSLHYLLPFVIAGVVVLHIWALHVPGNGNPLGVPVRDRQDTLPFHPYYTSKDLFGLSIFILIFAWFVFYQPNYLGHPDNYIPADPLKTPAHIVPEWYFLPFYAILRSIPSKLGGVIAFAGAVGVMFFVPWLDRSKVRSARFRPIYRQFFWILVACCIGLGYLGSQPPEGGALLVSRLLTAYYFAHFLIIMPIVGLVEKPKPLPTSITQSVLARRPEPAPAPAAGAE
jgi:quinol-cytochrome oxidoreductase complex cytochrome b subunit